MRPTAKRDAAATCTVLICWVAVSLSLAGCEDSTPAVDGGAGLDGGTEDAGLDAGVDAGPQSLPQFDNGIPPLDGAGCPPLPASPDLLDQALGQEGLDRCTLGYTSRYRDIGYYIDDAYRLPYFNRLHDHPLLLPGFSRNLAADLDGAATSLRPVAQLIAAAQARLGAPIQASDPGPELQAPPGDTAPFAHAVEALIQHNGGQPDAGALEQQAQSIPDDLQRALVPIINLLSQAQDVRTEFMSQLDGGYADLESSLANVPFMLVPTVTGALQPPLQDPRYQSALAQLDPSVFASYAARLAMAVESADLGRFRDLMGPSFAAATPLGAIVVGDGASNEYPTDSGIFAGNILFLLDTGGDDLYRIPVGGTVGGQPAALAIDLGGNDIYVYDVVSNPRDGSRLPSDSAGRYFPSSTPDKDDGPFSLSTTPRQGAAILGVGLLFDYGGGADRYRSLRMSQGFGAFGVGVLYDDGGDDIYQGEAAVQGVGMFGIGILADGRGNDRYQTYTEAQGFGFSRGIGVLLDLQGNDQYLADVGDPALGGDPLYLSPQLPGKGNTSLVQGTGDGRRSPETALDHLDMSGGLGVLRDVSGDDVYQASVFGQASGYWGSIGLLLDSQGNDQYDGLWYVQGADAHNSICVLLDEAGNDRYNQNFGPVATSVGVGHDFSIGMLLDLGGDDQMTGRGLCLGEGNSNGLGLLVNAGGDDTFIAPGYNGTPGQFAGCLGTVSIDANDPTRKTLPTYGFFVKAGGRGTYLLGPDGGAVARDETSWANSQDPTVAAWHGRGIDMSDAGVSLP